MEEYRREQHFAVSLDGVLTNIDIAHESNEEFYCPHCGCKMLKRCGKIRKWHFAHDWRSATEEQRNCSYESYLHAYAKIRIKEWFEKSQEIIICYNDTGICEDYETCSWRKYNENSSCKKTEQKEFNIKKILNKCEIEKGFNINGELFRPDLLWYDEKNNNNNIFIEIKVTHECTEKKKNSNNRIIEFDICSEEDVEKIISGKIIESDIVHFYGFKTERRIKKYKMPHVCLYKFQLYESGKCHIDYCNCHNIDKRKRATVLEIVIPNIDLDRSIFYTASIAKVHALGYPIRSCLLCKYRKCTNEATPYCEKTGSQIEVESEAIKCPDYLYNKKSRDYYLNSFKNFEYDNLSIWEIDNISKNRILPSK